MRQQYASLILIGAIVGAEAGLAGCATKGFVSREVESANALTSARIEEVATQVEPSQVEVLEDQGTPMLTLVTCYPFRYIGNAPQRFVVRARHVQGPAGVVETAVGRRTPR